MRRHAPLLGPALPALVAVILGLPAVALAQIKVQDVPREFFDEVLATGSSKRISEKDLLALQPGPLPAELVADLKARDFYALCSYGFVDKAYRSPFDPKRLADGSSMQLDFTRVDSDGVVDRMYLFKPASRPPAIYTTTFDKKSATKLVGFKKIKGTTYRVTESYGEQEHHRFVSYKDGVLVIDLTRNGRVGEKKVMFREAFISVKRAPGAPAAPNPKCERPNGKDPGRR